MNSGILYSATNEVLQNEDLVQQILEHFPACVDFYIWRHGNIETLLKASLVCHVFRKPAQDILWRKVDSILPLFKVLPTFQRWEDNPDDADVWRFTEPLSLEDVTRIQLFGSRIRYLDLTLDHNYNQSKIQPSAFIMVASALQGRFLLPNVREVEITLTSSGSCAVLPLLYSPCLEEVRIVKQVFQLPYDHCDISVFILRLSSLSKLHCLLLPTLPIDKPISKAVSSLRSLKTLHFAFDAETSFDLSFLASISVLDLLADLEISWSKALEWGPKSGAPKFRFTSLHSLRIPYAHVKDVSQLFAYIEAPCLEKITCLFALPNSFLSYEYPWTALFAGMGDSSPFLSELDFSISQSEGMSAFEFVGFYTGVPFEQISGPLLSLQRLTHLSFAFPLLQSVKIKDLEKMAQAWPHMKTLRIMCSTALQPYAGLEANALFFIAEHFPRLEHLNLALNMESGIPPPPEMLGAHPLMDLYVRLDNWDERVPENVEAFASLIDSLSMTPSSRTLPPHVPLNAILTVYNPPGSDSA